MRSLLLTVALLPALAAGEAPAGAERPVPAVIAPLAIKALLLDVKALPDGRLVAVGERGHVLVSNDNGTAWTQSPAPARATLTAVYFADARRGWAVGHDEVILSTVDGGANWSLAHYAPEREQPLLGVWFDAAGHGLAVGAYSTLYRSSDGGATWASAAFSPQPLPIAARGPAPQTVAHAAAPQGMRADATAELPHLTAIAADGGGRLYLAGEAGHLYRSEDGGAHWYSLPSPYEGSFFGLLPLAGNSLLAFGMRGHLYRSDDAGQSWEGVATHTEALLSGAARLPDGTIVVAGLAGVVLVSQDGGHSFSVHQEADRMGFSGAAAVPGGVVVCGEAGVRRLTLAQLAPRS